MGLAASQSRFLAITSRKMNCEFQSMQIAQQKLSVTRDLQKAAQDYQSSLNATKLVWDVADDLGVFDVSYDIMMTPTVLNEFDPYLITDKNGKVVLSKPMFEAAVASGIIDANGDPTGINGTGKIGAGPFKVDPNDSTKWVFPDSYQEKSGANDGSRNAFLYQIGHTGLVDMNTIDQIIALGEAGYTKSGVGGQIFSKTSTNAMNVYSFKEYMKKADYALYQQAGNTIPDGKKAKDLIYSFNVLDILNTTKNETDTNNVKENGFNYVGNYEKLKESGSEGKFIITKNGQNVSQSQLENLTIGDLLEGKYDISYKSEKGSDGKAKKYDEDAKAKFSLLFESLARTLGYDASSTSYVGLNVDPESDAALDMAFQFTGLSLTTVTDKSSESDIVKLGKIADEQNNVIEGKNGVYTLSLTNLLKSFLTNFAVGLEGFGSEYGVKVESAKDSNYVTSDLDYMFIMKNESAMTDTVMLNADFYNMLYNQIATCGACTDETKQEKVTENDWLQQQLKRGSLFISSLNNDGYFYQGAYTLNGHVKEVKDEDAITKAELEYNVQKSKLNTKEESLELQMKNLDMEISSLTTEYDTVKNLISKSIEKVFTMFSM